MRDKPMSSQLNSEWKPIPQNVGRITAVSNSEFSDVIEGRLSVRRVDSESQLRHFTHAADYKCRIFVSRCLFTFDKMGYSLRSAETLIHHYSPTRNSLIVKFKNKSLELRIVFTHEDELLYWKRAFDHTIATWQKRLDYVIPRILFLLPRHIREHVDPCALAMVKPSHPPSAPSTRSKHHINVITKSDGQIIEWRVRKLVEYEKLIQSTNEEFFVLPAGLVTNYNNHLIGGCPTKFLHDSTDNHDRLPYLMQPYTSISTTQYSSSPLHSSTASQRGEEKAVSNSRDSSLSDDFILVDEIDDQLSFISDSRIFPEISSPVEPMAPRLTPHVSLSSLCRINVNTFVEQIRPRRLHIFGSDHSNVPLKDALHQSLKIALPGVSSMPMPRLSIVIMAVGTRGDIQPFLLLAKRLRGTHQLVHTYGSSLFVYKII